MPHSERVSTSVAVGPLHGVQVSKADGKRGSSTCHGGAVVVVVLELVVVVSSVVGVADAVPDMDINTIADSHGSSRSFRSREPRRVALRVRRSERSSRRSLATTPSKHHSTHDSSEDTESHPVRELHQAGDGTPTRTAECIRY